MNATHVVVDTWDGYTFWRDADNELFLHASAIEFANKRNAELARPGQYKVFALIELEGQL